MKFALILVVFSLFFKSGYSISCHLCEGEDNCQGTSCVGIACIKREAYFEGQLRVQKMCQVSGGIPSPGSRKGSSEAACRESLLWQGNLGTECVCYSDWCNSSKKTTFIPFILFLSILSFFNFR